MSPRSDWQDAREEQLDRYLHSLESEYLYCENCGCRMDEPVKPGIMNCIDCMVEIEGEDEDEDT